MHRQVLDREDNRGGVDAGAREPKGQTPVGVRMPSPTHSRRSPARAPLPPLLSAALWLGAVGAFTVAIHRLNRRRPPDLPRRMRQLTYAQLATGLVIAHQLGRRPRTTSRLPGAAAAMALLGVQAGQYAVAEHRLPRGRPVAQQLGSLAHYVTLIGFVEELWFRGIWFEICRHRFWPSVVLGSALFGLYHWPHGWRSVLTTAGVGSVFAMARLRGASLGELSAVHGLIDWLNREALPGVRLRIPADAVSAVFPVYSIVLASAIAALPPVNPSTSSR